jgi:ADP-heptose:LPS heptosyltransferase
MNILIFNAAGVGDFVELIPWLYFAKKQKDVYITLVVSDRVYEYAKKCSYADEVFYLKSDKNHIRIFSFFNILLLLKLNRKRYDFIINTMPVENKFSLFLFKLYVSLIKKATQKNVFIEKISDEKNHYRYYKIIFEKVGILEEDLTDNIIWHEYPDSLNISSNKKIIGINLAGNTLTNRWLYDRWISLILKISGISRDFVFLFFSDLKNYDFVNSVYEKIKEEVSSFLIYDVSIEKWIGYIKKCDIIISVDSSIIHIASIFKKPCIVISGPVDPNITEPYFNRNLFKFIYKKVSCSPCNYYICPNKGDKNMICMKSINVEEIFKEFLEVYENNSHNNKN